MPTQFVSPATLAKHLRAGVRLLLVDVRSPAAFTAWHLPGSINVPADAFGQASLQLPEVARVVVICNRGHASQRAAEVFVAQGISAAVLAGGLKAWNAVYDITPVPSATASPFTVFQVKRLGKGCLSYLLVLPDRRAVIIDPTRHLEFFQRCLAERGLSVAAVLDTHVHADHLSGGRQLATALGVPYLLPQASAVEFPFAAIEQVLPEVIGEPVQVIATPGHTEESVCIAVGGAYLVTGDTLFLESVGRSDLGQAVGANAALLYRNVVEQLWPLPDDLLVLPAHTTTTMLPGEPPQAAGLDQVRRRNDLNRFPTAAEFAVHVSRHLPPTPPNYDRIKAINQSGLSGDQDFDELELGANRCAVA